MYFKKAFHSIGDWFRATVGVRPSYVLFSTLFNIFLERIMTDALNDHEGTVSIGGRKIIHLRFADDIDGLAETEEELANLMKRLDKTSTAFVMQINAEKTKLIAFLPSTQSHSSTSCPAAKNTE